MLKNSFRKGALAAIAFGALALTASCSKKDDDKVVVPPSKVRKHGAPSGFDEQKAVLMIKPEYLYTGQHSVNQLGQWIDGGAEFEVHVYAYRQSLKDKADREDIEIASWEMEGLKPRMTYDLRKFEIAIPFTWIEYALARMNDFAALTDKKINVYGIKVHVQTDPPFGSDHNKTIGSIDFAFPSDPNAGSSKYVLHEARQYLLIDEGAVRTPPRSKQPTAPGAKLNFTIAVVEGKYDDNWAAKNFKTRRNQWHVAGQDIGSNLEDMATKFILPALKFITGDSTSGGFVQSGPYWADPRATTPGGLPNK